MTQPVTAAVSGRRTGFTLIELLIVIAVISVLMALLLPAVQQARESARRTQCRNNLRQLGIALYNYHDVFRTFPAGGYGQPAEAYFQTGAFVALLPYLDQVNLAAHYDFSLDWEDPSNHVAVATPAAVFVCPSSSQDNPTTSETWLETTACPCIDWPTEFGVTSYVYSKGPNDSWCEEGPPARQAGMFELNEPVRVADVTDGTSNTLCMGEGSCSVGWYVCELGNCPTPAVHATNGEVFRPLNPWATAEVMTTAVKNLAGMVATSTWGSTQRPMNENPVLETFASTANNGLDQEDCRDSGSGGPHATSGFRSDHSGGVMFLLTDGSVQFLSESVDQATYQALSTRSGQEAIAFQ